MYTIEFDKKEDDSSTMIPIVEEVVMSDAISDSFGIDKDTNSLWFGDYFDQDDLEESDTQDFLRENFGVNRQAVSGFVRRLIINR